MEIVSIVIGGLALFVSVLSAWFAWSESKKTRAERVEDRVREIALSGVRPLLLGINSAQFAMEFEEPPTMFTEYETSGLHELAPRLRRAEDRQSVAELARSIDHVGAHWADTISAWKWWESEKDPNGEGLWQTGPQVDAAFAQFDERRREFMEKGEALLRDIRALAARIDARYR